MNFLFYLVIVKKAAAEENEDLITNTVGTNPKFYLKPVTVMPLDTFSSTHGPYTDLDGESDRMEPSLASVANQVPNIQAMQ